MDTRPARNASLSPAPPGTESILEAEIKARIEQIEFQRDEESAAMSERLHFLVMEYKRRDQALVHRHSKCLEDLFRRLPAARTLPWAARCREVVERETFFQGGVAIKFYPSPRIGQPPRRTDTRVERATVTTWRLPNTTATAGLLSAAATARAAAESAVIAAEGLTASTLDDDGYTSTDSVSGDRRHPEDWELHQVKTRTFATNPGTPQYWHWVAKDQNVVEHQVLQSVQPTSWAIFKKPYNFHLNLRDIRTVSFAQGTTKVIVKHKKKRDGKDIQRRGHLLAQFKRERSKRRFLTFLREKGFEIAEIRADEIEVVWNSHNPEMLPSPDSRVCRKPDHDND